MTKKSLLAQILTKFVDVHGDVYDYSDFVYSGYHTKGTITCRTHGDFLQTPGHHIRGQGCPSCKKQKLSTDRLLGRDFFIKMAVKTHGDVYDYSDFVYSGYHAIGKITCRLHGVFEQKPSVHLKGSGCPKCAVARGSDSRKLSTEDFVEKARAVHADTYSYAKCVYTTAIGKVWITCKSHGDFLQAPNHHLAGVGCPVCGDERSAVSRKLSTEDFVEKARAVHADTYSYAKCVYQGSHTKCCIVCARHGDFWQTPTSHLSGTGCPTCKSSKGELLIAQILDKHSVKYTQQYMLPLYRYRYDFYLPDHNLFIEFHGEQHYRPVKHFGGEESFADTQFRDRFKLDLARSYGVNVLYLNYRHLGNPKEQFEERLLNALRKFQDRRDKSPPRRDC